MFEWYNFHKKMQKVTVFKSHPKINETEKVSIRVFHEREKIMIIEKNIRLSLLEI